MTAVSSTPLGAPALTRGRRRVGGSRATLAIVALAVLVAVLAPLLAPDDPNATDVLQRLADPSLRHPLGTDDLGRDVLSRLIMATRTDLGLAVVCVTLPCLIGSTLGALGGYFGGLADQLVMRVCDLVLGFPVYVLIITLVALLGAGAGSIVVAFTLVGWVPYARLMRDGVRRVGVEDYVAAAYLGGLSRPRILFRHVLPNTVRPTVAFAAIDMMLVILTVSSFSYLGLGVPAPTAEWGTMVADGQQHLQEQWWLTAAPGAAIALVGLAFVMLSETLDATTSKRVTP
jgi:peptide/nickel transport system permease protein